MSYTEQLERETEQARNQIADTLEELRTSMTPRQVFNQLADRVGDAGGAAFVSNLKRQTINNPVPVALIGAGLAWLMLGGRRSEALGRSLAGDAAQRLGEAASAAGDAVRGAADATAQTASRKGAEWRDAASQKRAEWSEAASQKSGELSDAAGGKGAEWSDQAAGLADDARRRAGSAADRARQSAAEAADAVEQMAGSVTESAQRSASAGYEALSDGARRTAATVSGSTRAAGQRTLQAGNAFADFCRDEPLVLAGLGLAIGAAIGALLPQTETEDRLMGERSDKLKERAQGVVSEQYEAAKKVGDKALDAAGDEAAKQAGEQSQAASSDAAAGAGETHEPSLVPTHFDDPSPGGSLSADDPHP
ncbi:DUF3618 domain-containing protein [Bradyrhizobium sp. ARR65]|uniref:DUF3618 domain-containing protein n=1 Tax=Bradyrhizobium sp. ARR65 TaxID=1040989 RepID=UPI0004659C1A|nr:DUF3618 domain-containing protein [Bradyrhizobium sp. ARR65]